MCYQHLRDLSSNTLRATILYIQIGYYNLLYKVILLLSNHVVAAIYIFNALAFPVWAIL